MLAPIFYGKVEKGELRLIGRDRFKEYLYTLNGQEVEVTVAKKGRKRSEGQNKYLWGVVYKLLSDYFGYTPDEMHELMKQKFAPKKEVKMGNEIMLIPCSTTELLTTNFNDYLDQIKQFGAENNVII
ncbi:hypothetical protein HGB13_04205, partial [bacterium]|nr:hypothetical protein [bacterium]